MELTDRLTNIVERLHQRGVEDITDQDMINKLFSALDASFDPIIAEIEERPDYEELHSVEIMKLLTIHEENMEKENEQPESSSEEGEIFSDYGSGHEEDVENQHSITREREMLAERLNNLKRQNLSLTNIPEGEPSESSRRLPPKDMKCFECK
jgi:hypothetical protein